MIYVLSGIGSDRNRLRAVSLLLENLYLSSVFEFVPSQLVRLRCSNNLAYRFSSGRETAHSLKDTQHENDVPVL